MTEEAGLGCDHYRRKCSFITPCCNKEYICRICHDEKEAHELNRKEVQTIKCLKCGLQQKVKKECESCDTLFGVYFCEVCRLYDDTEKGQFHCDKCGICRVGGRENYFHCDTCDLCLGIYLKDKHKCVQESSRRNCAVCLEYLHTSRNEAHVPKCGHLIHSNCYRQCLKTGIYACPTCNQSLVDMKAYWEVLDNEIANTPMPADYKDFFVQILCKDCHKHTIGYSWRPVLMVEEETGKSPERTTDPREATGKLIVRVECSSMLLAINASTKTAAHIIHVELEIHQVPPAVALPLVRIIRVLFIDNKS